MTDNEATRTTFVRTRPALHEDEAGCYEAEAEAENFRLEANRLNYGTELKAVKAVKAITASVSPTTV